MSTQATAVATRRSDPRITALRRFAISITVFNVVGHLVLGFEQAYLTPIVAVLTAYAVELLLETVEARALNRPARYRGGLVALVNFLLPAHIAGLACAMLLYGNQSLAPTMFAVAAAVSSKYVIRLRINGALRHVFNPSNLGISLTLIFFSWVAIAPPYHFSEDVDGWIDVAIPLVILVAGTMLNAKLTRRMPLILGWVGGFVLQAVLRWAFFDAQLAAALLPMTGIAFIIFTNYMITDPATTPIAPTSTGGLRPGHGDGVRAAGLGPHHVRLVLRARHRVRPAGTGDPRRQPPAPGEPGPARRPTRRRADHHPLSHPLSGREPVTDA